MNLSEHGRVPGNGATVHARWQSPFLARIGPNAITQVRAALERHLGDERTREIFVQACLLNHFECPPQHMVDEYEVISLHRTLHTALGDPLALTIAQEAGQATARYLLAHRIPRPIRWLLRCLPASKAAHVLLLAIRRHAWTFAGSGRFSVEPGPPIVLVLRDNPFCRGLTAGTPSCAYYAATFEQLFRLLVHPAAYVTESHCEAAGDDACKFVIDW